MFICVYVYVLQMAKVKLYYMYMYRHIKTHVHCGCLPTTSTLHTYIHVYTGAHTHIVVFSHCCGYWRGLAIVGDFLTTSPASLDKSFSCVLLLLSAYMHTHEMHILTLQGYTVKAYNTPCY